MDKYFVLNEIGSGSYGVVRKVKRKSDNKTLICKEIKLEGLSEKERELMANEMNILRELNHPNIVKQYETIKDYLHSKIYIIMEFCEGGDLDKLILKNKSNRKFIDENLIWDIAIQTLKALDYLHNDKKVLHRDIKPSNLFLDKNYNIKLGDFGLSRKYFTSYVKTILGTPLYMSPEILDNKPYNEKADIWALGCSIYELASFNPPHYASNQRLLKIKVQTEPIKRIDKKYSDDLWNFISKMLTYDYNYRPSTKELINQYNNIIKSKDKNNLEDIQNKWEELLLYEENLKKKEKEQKEKEERFNLIQKQKENELKNKEKSLYEMLNKIQKMEQEQKEKERQLKMREKQLQEKERKLKEKEQKIDNNPNLVNNNNQINNIDLNNNNFNNLMDLNIKNFNNNNNINNNQINVINFGNNNQNNDFNNIENNLIDNINNNLNLNDNNNMNNFENQVKINRTIPKKGLKNIGDSSYLNAILQFLANIEEFSNYFLEPDTMSFIDNVKIEMPLAFEIKEFLLNQYTENGNNREAYDPSQILKVLFPGDNAKRRVTPNDLLKNILNKIDEEMLGNNIDKKYAHNEYDKNDTITKGINHYNNMNNSKIYNILNFFEIISHKCLKCNMTTYEFNSVYFITLNILKYYKSVINKDKEKFTINAFLKFQNNFQKEIFCKRCNHNESMKISSKIYNPPKILLVLIDRGINLNQNNQSLKVPFLVEEKINLNNFIENRSAQMNYELNGIISISVCDKKYVVSCKSYIDNQWYYYNDEKVQPIQFNNVLKSNNNNTYYIPCILIYKLI